MGLKIANALIAVVAGVIGSMVLFWALNKIVELLPPRWEERLKPYVFVGPALAVIIIFLIYPAITTIYASFLNSDSTAAVGISNYTALLGERDFQSALVNNLLWLIIVPASVVALGLLVATLADRLSARSEKLAKTLIFMPMAIAMVAASTIWRFIYDVKPAGEPQIGMLNAVVTAFGADPVNWLQLSTLRFNSFLLMVVFMWTQIGFSMVLLSAAIKAVPDDTIEAGRIDGAGERQIFFRIVVPQVWPTVITVFITVLISVLKVFDVVYVMTNGQFNTNVIGNAFVNELFKNGENGRASAIVVMLMIVIVPVLIYQVRQFRKQEMIQ